MEIFRATIQNLFMSKSCGMDILKVGKSRIRVSVGLVIFACLTMVLDTSGQTIDVSSFIYDNIDREYRTYIPEIYDGSQPVPLIINLHGYGSNSTEQLIYGNFTAIADTANFIVVHPDGTLDGQGNQFWNAFGVSDIDDIGFISALIDTLQVHYNIDSNCIYSTGMSNGGFMSYSLACGLSSRITAIASVAGSMVAGLQTTCDAQHPTPVMQIHGTDDSVVNYNGGFGLEPIEDVVEYWVEFNNCAAVPIFNEVPDVVTTDNCTAEHYVYEDGDNGSSVEFYKVMGGDHTWPGAIVNISTTNMDFNASLEIWRFFRRFKLDMFVSVENFDTNVLSDLLVYPNPSKDKFDFLFENSNERKITWFDSQGRELGNAICRNTTFELDFESPGIYLISVAEGDQVSHSKLVRQ